MTNNPFFARKVSSGILNLPYPTPPAIIGIELVNLGTGARKPGPAPNCVGKEPHFGMSMSDIPQPNRRHWQCLAAEECVPKPSIVEIEDELDIGKPGLVTRWLGYLTHLGVCGRCHSQANPVQDLTFPKSFHPLSGFRPVFFV